MTPFDNIGVDISVVLGTTLVPIHQLLRMGRGAVIELDARESDDVKILANDIPVAHGQVVLRGDRIGITITEVLFRAPAHRPRETVRRM
ncbi:flagellar motor switch protein FliN [Siculibacillus lacustris]|uniref:Flagellar motor switch protein FliN n=1 Tax=Siculibacillus lacustris TaxID=1549641 RepID=A0A4Q9VGD2_9HYPH|nr:FliM/FliN family flagellar motor switch protein [Siculibacillus lacustris]TBW34057.1 flagellar motor switch protein FliN [Siculibacillus lacustris]